MAKETPFDRARDFVEEKIDRTKETLGDSYSKARDQFDDVSEDVRKTVKSTAKQIEKSTGADTKTMEMFGPDPKTGKEFKMMTIELTRKPGGQASAAPAKR